MRPSNSLVGNMKTICCIWSLLWESFMDVTLCPQAPVCPRMTWLWQWTGRGFTLLMNRSRFSWSSRSPRSPLCPAAGTHSTRIINIEKNRNSPLIKEKNWIILVFIHEEQPLVHVMFNSSEGVNSRDRVSRWPPSKEMSTRSHPIMLKISVTWLWISWRVWGKDQSLWLHYRTAPTPVRPESWFYYW